MASELERSGGGSHVLQEVSAPAGWTSLLLRQSLPVDDEQALLAYREAVGQLLDCLPLRAPGAPEFTVLQFSRCRPQQEVPSLRANAAWWSPRFGVGIWLHQPPPTMWTRDEVMTTPGRPRPIIERMVLLTDAPEAQRSIRHAMLGSGALLQVTGVPGSQFLEEATARLKPLMVEESLTSFPFYLPLLTAAKLQVPHPAFDSSLDEQLPGVAVYLRESVEDDGLFILLRQRPELAWQHLLQHRLPFRVERLLPPELGG